jgi:hypothetical protein
VRALHVCLAQPLAFAFRCRGRPLCLPIRIAPVAVFKKGRYEGLPLRAAQPGWPGQARAAEISPRGRPSGSPRAAESSPRGRRSLCRRSPPLMVSDGRLRRERAKPKSGALRISMRGQFHPLDHSTLLYVSLAARTMVFGCGYL